MPRIAVRGAAVAQRPSGLFVLAVLALVAAAGHGCGSDAAVAAGPGHGVVARLNRIRALALTGPIPEYEAAVDDLFDHRRMTSRWFANVAVTTTESEELTRLVRADRFCVERNLAVGVSSWALASEEPIAEGWRVLVRVADNPVPSRELWVVERETGWGVVDAGSQVTVVRTPLMIREEGLPTWVAAWAFERAGVRGLIEEMENSVAACEAHRDPPLCPSELGVCARPRCPHADVLDCVTPLNGPSTGRPGGG